MLPLAARGGAANAGWPRRPGGRSGVGMGGAVGGTTWAPSGPGASARMHAFRAGQAPRLPARHGRVPALSPPRPLTPRPPHRPAKPAIGQGAETGGGAEGGGIGGKGPGRPGMLRWPRGMGIGPGTCRRHEYRIVRAAADRDPATGRSCRVFRPQDGVERGGIRPGSREAALPGGGRRSPLAGYAVAVPWRDRRGGTGPPGRYRIAGARLPGPPPSLGARPASWQRMPPASRNPRGPPLRIGMAEPCRLLPACRRNAAHVLPAGHRRYGVASVCGGCACRAGRAGSAASLPGIPCSP